MAWLLKRAKLVERVVINPGESKSGTCGPCQIKDGRDADDLDVGFPPFHPNCRCTTESVQDSTQPEDVIEETIELDAPFSMVGEPTEELVDPGGVETL